jgi:ribosomal protein L11 methyltransferase
LIRLTIRVRADRAEVALADLLPILGEGAEEREVDGHVEYSFYVEEPPPFDEIRALSDVVDVRTEPVLEGWETRWHEFLRPVRVGELVVRPPWIDGDPGDLVIDPGTYFGAGTHATTRICLELLQRERPAGAICDWGAGTGVLGRERPAGGIWDWGAGTGVLAIAAARLGWGPVTAVELEAGALEIIRANAARNGVTVEARTGDLREGAPWASTVLANLPKPVLLEIAGRLGRLAHDLAPATRIIASGMLATEADEVVAAFGMRARRRVERDGWAGVVLG